MIRILLASFLTLIVVNLYSQKSENNIIEVIQTGKHFSNNFLKTKRSSKKAYYFNSNGLILKSFKFGRYHYAYLNVIGQIETYEYFKDYVIETDSTFCCQEDSIFQISIDTLSLDFITSDHLNDKNYNVYDSINRLVQTENDSRRLKKYAYNKNGLISEITYYYKPETNDNLERTNQLKFKLKKSIGLSKEAILRINNFILWKHELGI